MAAQPKGKDDGAQERIMVNKQTTSLDERGTF